MEFLLEILTEELPAFHVKTALEQLDEKLRRELQAAGIAVHELRTLGTCRRLVVAAEMAGGQESHEETITGPPKSVAFLPDGGYSPAAVGFARAQGVAVESLQIIRTAKGESVGVKKVREGKQAREFLQVSVPSVISSLSFPKMMRWRESAFKFSRPIKNLLCLCDGKVLSFSFEGLRSTDMTFGHLLFYPQAFKVKSFSEYKELLKKKKVVVDPGERRKMIIGQIEEKLSSLKARVYPDNELLEKLAFNVEHPFVVLGAFPEKYLNLPIEVLSTAMREGQKLFSIVKDKKQLPNFLGVADTYKDSRSLIRKGNERVLRARLEDAKFFWEQDLKKPLAERSSGLKNVVFHEKLGSYDDKTQRMKKIVAYLCDRAGVGQHKKDAVEAAGLCKADLLTEMVREFPALQGKMGGLYARAESYPAAVCQAIYEHYQPLSLDDDLPSSLLGALMALADKIDSIVGVVGVGIQASGSSDPFGLRRNAHGICQIIIEKKLALSFSLLLDKTISIYGDKLNLPKDDIKTYCLEYFQGRLHHIFEKRGFRYDLINAAFGPGIDHMYHSFLRVKALESLKSSPQFESFILMAKRINNILREQPAFKVNPDVFVEKEERDLFSTFSIVQDNVGPMIAKGDFGRVQNIIFRIHSSLNVFFDKVLVMDKDKKLRQNRLALLQAIRKLLLQVADYSQVVVEGEKPSMPRASNPR